MFLPSIHGWPFPNDYECSGPELGLGGPPPDELGMGGGMCWSALDRYLRGATIPRDTPAPAPGDPLHAELYQRQVAAVGGIWPRVREWHSQADGSWRDRLPIPIPPGDDLASWTRTVWRSERRSLRAGEPILLTLLPDASGYERHRAVKQVLATGASKSGRRVRISLYDPDRPGDDRVSLSFNLAGPLDARTSDGTWIRAFFPVPYDRDPAETFRTESFDDRSVLGLNRDVQGRPAMVARRNGIDLVGRSESGALIHFRRVRSRHWESTNVTERPGFGIHELHTDPTAVRVGGTLHVFALNYVGDLLHFRHGRSWRVKDRTDSKRIGARYRMIGRPAAVAGSRGQLNVIGRDDADGLIFYESSAFKGWTAEQVAGNSVAGDPVADRVGDILHVVALDREGRLLHWQRQTSWTMTDPEAADGPSVRLEGTPQLAIHDGAVHVFGRTRDRELAILSLGQAGSWRCQIVARNLAGDPRTTAGPAGTHVFAPGSRSGLVHVWLQDGEWQWEDILDNRPALQAPGSPETELACWGGEAEIRVFERRGSTVRCLTWTPDADWVVDTVSTRANSTPVLFADTDGEPHLFLTDRWGTVIHAEKSSWREPARPVEDGQEEETAAASMSAEAVAATAGTRSRAPEADEHEAKQAAEGGAAHPEAGSSGPDRIVADEEPAEEAAVEGLELDELVTEQPVAEPAPVEGLIVGGSVAEEPAAPEPAPEEPAVEETAAEAPADQDPVREDPAADDRPAPAGASPLAGFDPIELRDGSAGSDDMLEDPVESDDDDLPFLAGDEDELEVTRLEATPPRQENGAGVPAEELPLLGDDEGPGDELPLLDDADGPAGDLPLLDAEDGADADVPIPEGGGAPADDLPLLDADDGPVADPGEAEEDGRATAADKDTEPDQVNRRVKGGPARPHGTVDVEPMDLSLLDTWPDTGRARRERRAREKKGKDKPANGGSPS